MTRRLLAFLLLVAGPGSLAAQTLINKGAHLVVQAGATLYVHSALLNLAGGTLSNAGTVLTTGNAQLPGVRLSVHEQHHAHDLY